MPDGLKSRVWVSVSPDLSLNSGLLIVVAVMFAPFTEYGDVGWMDEEARRRSHA